MGFLSDLFKTEQKTQTDTRQNVTTRQPLGSFGGGFDQQGQNFGDLAGQNPNDFFAGLNPNQQAGIQGLEQAAGSNPFLQGASGALNAGLGFNNPFTQAQGQFGQQALQSGLGGLQQTAAGGSGATGGFFGGPTFEPSSFGGPGTNFGGGADFGPGSRGQGAGDFQTAGFQDAFNAAADPLFERFQTETIPGIASAFSQAGRLRGGGGLPGQTANRATQAFARGIGQATAPFALQSSQQAADRNFQAQQNQFGRQFTGEQQQFGRLQAGDQANLARLSAGQQNQFGREFTGGQGAAERARLTQQAGLGRAFQGQESAQGRQLAAQQGLVGQGFAGLGNAGVGARGDVGTQLASLSGVPGVDQLRRQPGQNLFGIGLLQQQQEQARLNQPFTFGGQLNQLGQPGLALAGNTQDQTINTGFSGPSQGSQLLGAGLSLAGTAAGAFFGGPVGASIGGQLGSQLGSVFTGGGGFGGGGQAGFNPAEFNR